MSATSFPTSSALCQARSKISHKAFIELNSLAVETFYEQGEYRKWKDHRVLAIDGSTLRLPKSESIENEFGVHEFGPKANSSRSLARISYLYDVFNGLVLDAQMESFSTSEADMAWEQQNYIKENDIVLYDRYYPSLPLMCSLKSRNTHFCFKMKTTWWTKVKDFANSKSNDKIVCFKLPEQYKRWAEDNDIPKVIKCRLIKKKNKSGELEIICTSLLDMKKYSRKAIFNLYKERWSIEEGYKLIKARLDVENFSGVKALVVKQDFYAKTLLLTLNAILCNKIKPSKKRASGRIININRTAGLTTTKKLFLKYAIGWTIPQLIDYYTNIMEGKFNYSRKGQSTSRKKINHNKFNVNYKTA